MSPALNLDWKRQYNNNLIPEVSRYKYYFGDISWGQIIYVGTVDLLGMETELQLYFNRKKISKALLILGPDGINHFNCFEKYKKVTGFLSKKYGNNIRIFEKQTGPIEDLFYVNKCTPVGIGMQSVETTWTNKKYSVKASLFGEDKKFYIEIEYFNLKNTKQDKNKNIINNL
tara:strand:- start:17438 stop:17953 length:516 start_codon:yes stop_codon:yes gene_type:complete